jgi:hypothetical protein
MNKQRLRAVLAPAKLSDTGLTPKTFQYNPDLIFR